MKKTLIAFCTTAMALTAGSASAASTVMYKLTIANNMAKQGLSPPVLALNEMAVPLYSIGAIASPGLSRLAEDGETMLLKEELEKAHPHALVRELKGVKPKAVHSYRLNVRSDRKYLSLAAMIGTTNDTFVAVQGLELPMKGAVKTVAAAYDAGSEKNNEKCAYIPGPPCGNHDARDPSPGEGVSQSLGVLGGGDLSQDFSWGAEPVTITVERLD